MIIRLQGEFSKNELIEALTKQLNIYIKEDMSAKGAFYLNLYDEYGEPYDYYDDYDNSLEVNIISGKRKKKPTKREIELIMELTQQGKSLKEISDSLELANSVVAKTLNDMSDSNGNIFTTIMNKNDLDEFMFTESEANFIDENFKEYIEEVGIYRNQKYQMEKVFSARKYCEEHQLVFTKKVPYGYYTPTLLNAFLCNNDHTYLLNGQKPIGLTIFSGKIELLYDIKSILEQKDYVCYESERDVPKGFSIHRVKGLKSEQFENKEIGYVIGRYSHGLQPVYNTKELYEEFNISLITDEELEKEFGKTLFVAHTSHNYFPKTYGVKEELEFYGYGLTDGKEYHRTKRPLPEKFGLIPDEEISDRDILINPMKSRKLNNLLKKTDTPLDTIIPDGMTKDFLLVYREGRIPADVLEVYFGHLKIQELKEKLNDTK